MSQRAKYPDGWTPAQKAHSRYRANREVVIARAVKWREDHPERARAARREAEIRRLTKRLQNLTALDTVTASGLADDDFTDLL